MKTKEELIDLIDKMQEFYANKVKEYPIQYIQSNYDVVKDLTELVREVIEYAYSTGRLKG